MLHLNVQFPMIMVGEIEYAVVASASNAPFLIKMVFPVYRDPIIKRSRLCFYLRSPYTSIYLYIETKPRFIFHSQFNARMTNQTVQYNVPIIDNDIFTKRSCN